MPTTQHQPSAQSEGMPRIAWPIADLQRAIEPDLPGFSCEVMAAVDSTNLELMRRFKAGQLAPTLLVAEQQTAGRGRLGRKWHSARGEGLTFSLGMLLSPAAWSGLSLAVGVSLADSLDESLDKSPDEGLNKEHAAQPEGALRIGLKWPNDLWLTGLPGGAQKLAGVLIESAVWEGMRYAVIGVGINIRPQTVPVGQSGDSLQMAAVPPGHLQQLLPAASAADVLLRIMPPLVQAVQAFAQFGFAPVQARFARRDVLEGREIDLSDGGHGRAHGVTVDGGLRVQTAGGMVIVASNEVSVRPTALADSVAAAAAPKDLPAC